MEPTSDFPPAVPSGGRRHRRRPDAVKMRIVNESLRPGARVNEVAARHGVRANALSSWRTSARRGVLVAGGNEAAFATPVAGPIAPPPAIDAGRASSGPDIVTGSVTIRLEVGASAERIASVVRAPEGRP